MPTYAVEWRTTITVGDGGCFVLKGSAHQAGVLADAMEGDQGPRVFPTTEDGEDQRWLREIYDSLRAEASTERACFGVTLFRADDREDAEAVIASLSDVDLFHEDLGTNPYTASAHVDGVFGSRVRIADAVGTPGGMSFRAFYDSIGGGEWSFGEVTFGEPVVVPEVSR